MHRRHAAVLPFAFFLASPALAQPAAVPHADLTIGIAESIGDFNPYFSNALVTIHVQAAARRAMTGITRDGRVYCRFCTEVPTLANGRARIVDLQDGKQGMDVRYTLKPDLKWGDGAPFTAADFAFAFRVGQSMAPSPTIAAVDAPTPSDVVIHIKTTRYDFDRTAPVAVPEHIEGPIFDAAAGNAVDYGNHSEFNRHPENPGLWNGPYLVTEYRQGETITMAPNPYWEGKKPYFQKLTWRIIENTAALQANLLSGDVDMAGEIGLTVDQALAMQKANADRFDIAIVPTLGVQQLYVKMDHPLLTDPRVRRAIAMAIDRKTIVDRIFEGKVPLADSFITAGEFGHDPTLGFWPFDPKAARALLADAGFKPGPDGILVSPAGERFSIDISAASGNRLYDLQEQVMQSQLKGVGIELQIKNQPFRVLLAEGLRMRKFNGLALLSWTPFPDWVPQIRFDSKQIPTEENGWFGNNVYGIADPAMDTALMGALTALDPVQRKTYWNDIVRLAKEDLPIIPLYVLTSQIVTPKWMTGVAPPPLPGLSTGWIEEWGVK
jgi:peptide/nickel transport system substrate-binding protein